MPGPFREGGAPEALGAPDAGRTPVSGSSPPQSGHFFIFTPGGMASCSPHWGHFVPLSIAVGLKHMIRPSLLFYLLRICSSPLFTSKLFCLRGCATRIACSFWKDWAFSPFRKGWRKSAPYCGRTRGCVLPLREEEIHNGDRCPSPPGRQTRPGSTRGRVGRAPVADGICRNKDCNIDRARHAPSVKLYSFEVVTS